MAFIYYRPNTYVNKHQYQEVDKYPCWQMELAHYVTSSFRRSLDSRSIYNFLLRWVSSPSSIFSKWVSGISHIQWKSIRTSHWPNLHRELFDELSPAGNSTWDELQRKYQCCGINGSADFLGSAWAAYEENLYNAVPRSCCKDENNFHKCEIEGLWSQIHQIGCQTVLSTALYELSCQTKVRLFKIFN